MKFYENIYFYGCLAISTWITLAGWALLKNSYIGVVLTQGFLFCILWYGIYYYIRHKHYGNIPCFSIFVIAQSVCFIRFLIVGQLD